MKTTTRPLSYNALCANLENKMICTLCYTEEKALADASKYARIFCDAFSIHENNLHGINV